MPGNVALIWRCAAAQSMYNTFFQAYDWRAFIIAVIASGVGLLLAAGLEAVLIRPLLGDICGPCMPRRRAAATLPPDDAQKLHEPAVAKGAAAQGVNGTAPSAPSMYAPYPKI